MDIRDIEDGETLWKLRQEVPIGSVFVDDYKNSLGINKHSVCDFFDSYMEYLSYMHYNENNGTNNTFWDYVIEHDNVVNLYNFFMDYTSEV